MIFSAMPNDETVFLNNAIWAASNIRLSGKYLVNDKSRKVIC